MKKLSYSILIFIILSLALTMALSSQGNILNKIIDSQELDFGDTQTNINNIINSVEPSQNQIPSDLKQRAYEEVDREFMKSDSVPVVVWLKKEGSIDKIIEKMDNFKVSFVYKQFNGFAGVSNRANMEILRADKNVDYVVFDAPTKVNLLQSRRLIGANAVEANYSLRGNGVGVCMLDTGVKHNHTALVQAYVGGYDFVNNDSDPFDDNGHGTLTAGVVASNNTFWRGVATKVNLLAVKMMNASGVGSLSMAIAGVDWCVTNKNLYNISVISMSFAFPGTYTPSTNPGYMDVALQAAYNSNIVSVAASGNDGSFNSISYPAISPYVISVGSSQDAHFGTFQSFPLPNGLSCTENTTYADLVSCFSNRAPFLDLMAPGSRISAVGDQGDGTSMAAPHVSGTIALMKQRNPQMTVSQIENILKSTGNQIYDNATGLTFPRVNALEAVKAVPFLNKTGTIGPNANITFYLHSKLEPGFTTLFALSFGRTPGIPLPDGRTIPLNLDDLLLLSVQSPSTVFLSNSWGSLNANGQANRTMSLPNIPGIQNVEAYGGFITFNSTSGQLSSVSNAVRL